MQSSSEFNTGSYDMRNVPILKSDLEKVLKALPTTTLLPVAELIVPFKDSLTGEERQMAFTQRLFMRNGVEEKYWVALCFVASKGEENG